MVCRLLFAGLLVLLPASACSSTSTNEGAGGASATCAGQAAECYACCSNVDPGSNGPGAYVWALNEAVCVGSPGTCKGSCDCPNPAGLACASCAEGAVQSAVADACKGDCVAFRSCLKTCL